MPKGQDRNVKCSFCGKPQEVVKKIIAGPSGVFICDECVGLCQDIIEEEIYDEEEITEQVEMPTPAEIKKVLDEYVIGQEETKKTLSVAVYNHYKIINNLDYMDDVEVQKSNILLLRTNRLWKNIIGANIGQNPKCAICHCRRHNSYRSRICRRRCGKHSSKTASSS